MSPAIDCAFALESFTVLQAPFIMNAKISVSISNLASPFSNFFREIGPLPPWCPDVSSGGKTEHMAWRVALDARRIKDLSLLLTAPKKQSSAHTPTDV
jgi:hypothetical protein